MKNKYKDKFCSKCKKELSELEAIIAEYNGKFYCEDHFPLPTFVCEECKARLILKFRIKSENNVNICKRCLNDLVEKNMFYRR